MEARLRKFNKLTDRKNLRALADVDVTVAPSLAIVLYGCRVIQQPGQRAYVALPQVESADGRYFPVLSAPGLREVVQEVVLAEYAKDLAS